MLKSLSIENYALIDSLEINFSEGLSVVTGETGAGKSIILGALSLILGQRADTKHIKENRQKCTIEGVFDISSYDLKMLFEANDWQYDPSECLLRREIWANGKSRAFVNDSPVYVNDLKALGDALIDIHSQHQNLALNDHLFQLMVVDVLAKTDALQAQYSQAYTAFREAEQHRLKLVEKARKDKEEEDYLQFQFSGLSEARLQSGEQQELEQELEALTHAEEIKSNLFGITQSLSGEQHNVESLLKSALESAQNIRQVFPKIEDIVARLESAYIDLKDVRAESERFFDTIEFNPERQQVVEERLSLIYNLQKKHSLHSVEELLELQREIGQKLENISRSDELVLEAEKDSQLKKEQMLDLARQLSKKRQSVVPTMEKQLIEKLSYQGMPNARFQCEFIEKSQPDNSGLDTVQFLFSANKNSLPQPISHIASGGEISRLMLCLKAMIAGATQLPTIIFDEIDTGTSGEIADKMGTIMHDMSRDMQVVVITHLPQIASKGDAHYRVYKTETADSTRTDMVLLTPQERVMEIARMLSGAEISEQAVENAKVMLEK